MGIFGKGSSSSSIDPNGNISSSTRNRRNSPNPASSTATPVSIVPAPPQSNPLFKATTGSANHSVFGRQQSWSDQLADVSLLKGTSAKLNGLPSYPPTPVISQNIPYPNSNTTGSSGTNGTGNPASAVNNDVKFVHSTMEILENQIKREEAPKKKRTRTSTEQLRILQKAFQTDPMPNSGARAALSKKLGMSARAVQVWFQNRRAKEKLDAKRNMMGLLGNSSFTYIKGENSDDDEEGGSGSGAGNEDDDEFNFEDDESINNESNSIGKSTGGSEYLNSSKSDGMRANGMMSRMAFSTTTAGTTGLSGTASNEIPIKAQRSSSTPNGFFQGFPNSSISNQQTNNGRYNQIGKPVYSSHFNNFSSNNPLCHLFPGETFISDVNEASVDQLYQDLGGSSTSTGHSPIDDVNFSNQPPSITTNNSSSSANFFTFGDPFYGGGIIDRTPSVSPVGFGPRSHFYHPIGNSTFDFMLPNPHIANEFNALDTFSLATSTSTTNTNTNANTNNACKGISGGNVYLTSSISSNNIPASRRSFSLPEAHGNLTFQQMQQLENFGLQVFPSPLLSINEEKSKEDDDNEDNNKNAKISVDSPVINAVNPSNSSDFLIPFSDFLEGEVIR